MISSKLQQSGMVDISSKDVTRRAARASATVLLGKVAFGHFSTKGSPKGNVLETAKVAAVLAAKNTPSIIPLCHPLSLEKIGVEFNVQKNKFAIEVLVEVVSLGRTGVEMEALTAASTGALTIYDMMKWADKGITVSDVRLLEKSGGKSGHYVRGSR